jgi:sulfoxide reductase heme-binding subunit YedZ
MGIWGIRFLLLSLLMSPIYAFTGWRFPLKLRKPLGLVAFLFVCIHAYIHLSAKFTGWENYNLIQRLTSPYYIGFGAIAFGILILMTATSFKYTMKLMGRYWKPLHRLVYVAGVLMLVHSMLATSMSKRAAFMEGEKIFAELQIYLVILVILLLVRIPIIKRSLQAVIPFAPKGRKSKVKRSLITSP